jgi:hypothetical protein
MGAEIRVKQQDIDFRSKITAVSVCAVGFVWCLKIIVQKY